MKLFLKQCCKCQNSSLLEYWLFIAVLLLTSDSSLSPRQCYLVSWQHSSLTTFVWRSFDVSDPILTWAQGLTHWQRTTVFGLVHWEPARDRFEFLSGQIKWAFIQSWPIFYHAFRGQNISTTRNFPIIFLSKIRFGISLEISPSPFMRCALNFECQSIEFLHPKISE